MRNSVISVENLTKRYDLGVIGTGTLSRDLERWWARIRKQPDPFTEIGQDTGFKRHEGSILALDDVSFTVQQGETLGIIGKNGAGKSTLLKILSRVTAPTSGAVKIKGRIGSLLEVGTGFHPELTGRENVFLNGAILGMRKAEVQKKFDEIVDFSGVEQFIDTPVKRYSSGMYVRLAFAVAAHLDPEILIVDEVLAVGDAEFQKKCLGKMSYVAGEGRTVLFVSHNMPSIKNLCEKVIYLKDGRIHKIGETGEIISDYLNEGKLANHFKINPSERRGDLSIEITDFQITPSYPKTGEPLLCTLEIVTHRQVREPITADFSISFATSNGTKVFQLHSGHMMKGIMLNPGRTKINTAINSLLLTPGSYLVNLWIGSGKQIYDWVPEAYSFNVGFGSLTDEILVDNRGYPIIVESTWSSTPINE